MQPVIALVTAGVEMDVPSLTYHEYSQHERNAVIHAHPRGEHFKEGIKHKPDTAFGNVKGDVMANRRVGFKPGNFSGVIRGSAWPG